MKKNRTKQGYLLNTIVIVVLFALFQVLTAAMGGSGSFKLVLAPCLWQCCYLIILAASLNLVLGFLGQLSLGHCGFMAIGAYTAALLSLAAWAAFTPWWPLAIPWSTVSSASSTSPTAISSWWAAIP